MVRYVKCGTFQYGAPMLNTSRQKNLDTNHKFGKRGSTMNQHGNFNEPENIVKYRDALRSLMEHHDNRQYTKAHIFTQAELTTLTPDDIYKWMCKKVEMTDQYMVDHPHWNFTKRPFRTTCQTSS